MKKAVIIYDEENADILKEVVSITEQIWKDKEYEITKTCVSSEKKPHEYLDELRASGAAFVITYGMAGFQWSTLQEKVGYNIVKAKQIHILPGCLPIYDEYLRKEYAINLFFYADNEEIIRQRKGTYAEIPYLKKMPILYMANKLTVKEKIRNVANLNRIFDEVLDFIEKPSILE